MSAGAARLGFLAAALGLAWVASPVSAQDGELRGGVVSAETGEPIAGAWIALAGRGYGTYSRKDGSFRLPEVPTEPRRYDVAALGYTATTVALDPETPDLVLTLEPDESLLPGVELVLAHLEERRNGARLFDQQELAFSRAFDLAELLTMRGVRRVRKFCVDERWEPGAAGMEPGVFYRMEIHGSIARLYTEEFLAEMATKDPETIRRTLRPEQPIC
jgi:hypothetical protein